MSESLTSNRHLVWDTDLPLAHEKFVSPAFYFQNSELRFELTFEHSGYYLDMVETIPKSVLLFHFTCYIETMGSLTFQSTSIVNLHDHMTDYMAYFKQKYSNIDLRDKGKIKIVIILHDEVGSTLRLSSEKEKFRNAAVGTHEELGATSSNSGHSILEILSDDFSKLLDGDLYQDVVVKCGEETFKAHRAVLCTRSEVFLSMLQSDMLEGQTARVEVKNMESDVCKDLLRYMYSGKLPELSLEKARGLFEAADRYNVGGLMQPCAEFLIKNLTSDNACDTLVLADAHSDEILKDSVINYILDQKIPFKDTWRAFCRSHSVIATDVLNKFYELHGGNR